MYLIIDSANQHLSLSPAALAQVAIHCHQTFWSFVRVCWKRFRPLCSMFTFICTSYYRHKAVTNNLFSMLCVLLYYVHNNYYDGFILVQMFIMIFNTP